MAADDDERQPQGSEFGAAFSMPGHLLRRCHQISVSIFLDECAGLDLTPLQYVSLAALATHGPLDQAALGGVAALDRTTVAVILRNLRERNLVRTETSSKDRRSKVNTITSQGLALLERAHPAVLMAQKRTIDPLSAAERKQFARLLDKIARENNALSRAPQRPRRNKAI